MVGDQYDKDLIPAIELEMKAILVGRERGDKNLITISSWYELPNVLPYINLY
jgi:FMN phosphatase YigB (HAD superfamily)